ncbi:PfkB family carbohydrate kinase [Actinophytocola gossypii]|uniref:Bifunctional hydroxymethylpyrimidine kinase/phosphomethylpyrimidine kinase n=1 Tax=Actinophytocola gossypii TaxID=2812003 RepID=A0ABT2JIY0_9PSEU|nr:PfkB family carbohydrate kinase [Actinophytocola gossypii]MCT2587199.1 bifunctional hydroxymethylpyrimidine kinase/phosphomethylpyrimidine kinase [Actinophytocola gossypii]
MAPEIVFVGQIARDLVLRVPSMPGAGRSAAVRSRRELLGGKGANQAVGCAQLGASVGLLGVVGDDAVAGALLDQARADGVDVTPVVRRPGAETGLIVDAVDDDAGWHYLEHLPADVLLTEDDVAAAGPVLRAARAVVVQLQQPAGAALAAARAAKDAGGLLVLDGAPGDLRDELLGLADVVRADAREAELLTGVRLDDAAAAVRAGRELGSRHGVTLAALGLAGGDAFVWADDARVFPFVDTEVVDTTGAGDALVAGLTTVLCRGGGFAEAARLAVTASAATVGHPGGRPDLDPERLRRFGPEVSGNADPEPTEEES